MTICANELKKVWTDPELRSFTARVLLRARAADPTPRWSTYDAMKLHVAPPRDVASTVQEHAWTTPIWFTPSADAAKSAKNGMTTMQLVWDFGPIPGSQAL